jgi:RNA polymerase sigma factor (sigma-70 family)
MISIIENIEKFRSASRNGIASQIVIYSRNAAINCYNKNKRRSKRFTSITHLNEEGEKEDYNLPDLAADLDELIISRETVEIVQKYLQMLSTEQQDAIKLVYALGYSNVEAAKILHISPNAVGMRLFNAKKRLIDLAGGELSER